MARTFKSKFHTGRLIAAAVTALAALMLFAASARAYTAQVRETFATVYSLASENSSEATSLMRGQLVLVNSKRTIGGVTWCEVLNQSTNARLGYVKCSALTASSGDSPAPESNAPAAYTGPTYEPETKDEYGYGEQGRGFGGQGYQGQGRQWGGQGEDRGFGGRGQGQQGGSMAGLRPLSDIQVELYMTEW